MRFTLFSRWWSGLKRLSPVIIVIWVLVVLGLLVVECFAVHSEKIMPAVFLGLGCVKIFSRSHKHLLRSQLDAGNDRCRSGLWIITTGAKRRRKTNCLCYLGKITKDIYRMSCLFLIDTSEVTQRTYQMPLLRYCTVLGFRIKRSQTLWYQGGSK